MANLFYNILLWTILFGSCPHLVHGADYIDPGRFDQILVRAASHSHKEDYTQMLNLIKEIQYNGIYQTIVEELDSISVADNTSLASCVDDVLKTISSLGEKASWAISMVDSMGKLPPGVMDGNTNWLGSYSECTNVTVNYTDIKTRWKYFTGRYCDVKVAMANSSAVFSMGLCVPSSCSGEDVGAIIEAGIYSVLQKNMTIPVECHGQSPPLSTLAIVVICIFSVLIAVVVAATLYDVCIHQREEKGRTASESIVVAADLHDSSERDTLTSREYTPLLASRSLNTARNQNPPIAIRIILSLSLCGNAKKILNTSQQSNTTLRAVHGVRFLSMTWVMLGHTYVFIMMGGGVMANPLQLFAMTKRFTFQAILNATVSVDSFFLLSGLLVAYLTLQQMKEVGGPRRINWVLFYFHRFWRLTPPYILTWLLYVGLFYYMGEGPLWPSVDPNLECRKYWWHNLLYINNILTPGKECAGWAWYLANDMQFFIISPFFLIFLYWKAIIGLILLAITLYSCIASTIATTYIHDYPADMPDYLSIIINDPAKAAKMGNWFADIYASPWCRIGPYLIGIFVGYILYRTECKAKLHWVLVLLGWFLAAACNVAVLYGLYGVMNGHPMTKVGTAIYSGLHRPAWALGLGWVIFACATKQGGVVNKLLSWPAMIPLSRLTYMAYLMHPIVMSVYYSNRHALIYLDDLTAVYLFLGHLVVSYGVAFVASLVCEAPWMSMEKVLFKQKGR